ncbi:MAG: histidinol dehydrogenase, partial [Xanthomonadaceae bacterium]|nr:histidinol dehydrogenase [Xanthomonadaceae bacterium]
MSIPLPTPVSSEVTLPRAFNWAALDKPTRALLLTRPTRARSAEITADVAHVLAQVRAHGDMALRDLTRRFDSVVLHAFAIPEADFIEAERRIDPLLRAAMVAATTRIEDFHKAGMTREYAVDTAPGVKCERILRPIDRVGLYVPAGSAPLLSTALMLGVPARLAGCEEVVLCTPPRADGSVDDTVLVAAKL